MVVIRLARGGAKKRPFYKIVVADSRKPLKGRFIEKLGYYNPFASGGETPFHLDVARLEHWKNCGAQLSPRLHLLVKEHKKSAVIEGAEAASEKPKAASKKPKASAASTSKKTEKAKAAKKDSDKASE